MASKYYPFWENNLAAIKELIDAVRTGQSAELDVSGIRQLGHRASWNGLALVRGKKLIEAPMAHAASLGKMVASLGLCGPIPNVTFKFTISSRCILRVTSDQANIAHLPSQPDPESKPGEQAQPVPHNERCGECKLTVERLLEKLYGRVHRNYRFDVGAGLNDYKNSPYYKDLQAILDTLQTHRSFKDFIRTAILPPVDFFIPDPGFILEFDESQHFSECRKLSLEMYPDNLATGFDRERWITLCKKLRARDNDPPYRDEQRAWYDTLRDFLPTADGLGPTVRLYAADRQWCHFDPERSSDVDIFKAIVGGQREKPQSSGIELRYDCHPTLGRIVIDGGWSGELRDASELLHRVCEAWPVGEQVQCLITPGAFITFGSPDSLPNVADNISIQQETVDLLVAEVRKICGQLLTDDLVTRLSKCTRYMTIGVDSRKRLISQTQNYIRETHVEMVCLVDLLTRQLHVTGKSYPTPQQEHNLIRIPDLESHFLDLECGTVMVLGCHDLSMFNPRGRAVAQGWRRKVSEEFLNLAKTRRPSIVLHHPHTTIKTTTWIHAWNTLMKDLPWVEKYLSAGRYSQDDAGWSKRQPLDDVLAKTKMGDVLDVIVHVGYSG
jgi:hypothetical protein